MLHKEDLIDVFKKVEDPELHVDVWTLGLIYNYEIKDGVVDIKMTFTTPFCPYGPQLVDEIEEEMKKAGASEVNIEITFDPPWQPSDELREMMGM